MFSEESVLVAVGLKLKLWNQFWGRLGFSGGTVADNKGLVLKTLKRLKTGSPHISDGLWHGYFGGIFLRALEGFYLFIFCQWSYLVNLS